jgi:hypothetical protein
MVFTLQAAEIVLANIPKVYVYKVPPPKSAGQYRAEDWLVNPHVWTGTLRIVSQVLFV